MKMIVCFLAILIFCGFKMSSFFSKSSVDYEKIAHKITLKIAKKLNQEKGLTLFSTGRGMMDDVKLKRWGVECSFGYGKIAKESCIPVYIGYHCFCCFACERIINYHRVRREHRGVFYESFST